MQRGKTVPLFHSQPRDSPILTKPEPTATSPDRERSTKDKIRLFLRRFSGLTHVHGTYDPQTGRAWQVKSTVTEQVILDHLRGLRPFGLYLLQGAETTAIVADFDNGRLRDSVSVVEQGRCHGIPLHIERSKSKGFHAWMFLEIPISASKGRRVMRQLLEASGHGDVEVFPKQDQIHLESGEYGNFINAPLFGRLVPSGRTVFLDPRRDHAAFPNQWDFLETAAAANAKALDRAIALIDRNRATPDPGSGPAVLGRFEGGRGLPPCARAMLAHGVTDSQRVACFRLAVNLRRMGLDFDATVSVLSNWAGKNRPASGKRLITPAEIKAQAAAAFIKDYLGYGCEDPAVAPYCESHCPIHHDARRESETPAQAPPLPE